MTNYNDAKSTYLHPVLWVISRILCVWPLTTLGLAP